MYWNGEPVSREDANTRFAAASPLEILDVAVRHLFPGRIALVSSFGAESALLLHLLAEVDRSTPVIFLDTGKHFDETLMYRDILTPGAAGGCGDEVAEVPCRVARPDEGAFEPRLSPLLDAAVLGPGRALSRDVLIGGRWVVRDRHHPQAAASRERYRAVTGPGRVPQGYVSANQAASACAGAGKRLCSRDEFVAACAGPDNSIYPYGDTYSRGTCNEGRAVHPLQTLLGAVTGAAPWNWGNMNNPKINQQPGTLAETGSRPGCVSAYGVFDLVGNLHEWVDDPRGAFAGGYYADAEINGRG